MGVMRFRVCPPGFLEGWPEAEQAYISGFDGRVFPTRVEREGDDVAVTGDLDQLGHGYDARA